MAQIKYVVFGCLIFIFGWLIFTGFQKISPAQTTAQYGGFGTSVKEKPEVIMSAESIRGKQLFRKNCGACHAIDRVCGYPMYNVVTRELWAADKENIKKFIRDPKTFIPTTQYTRNLYKQFDQVMPSFPQLTNEDLEDLYQFLVYSNESRR